MSGRKKVILDNDNFLLYYPLTRDWCSYNEYWCKGYGGKQNASEYIEQLVKTTPGSYYILVKKEKNPGHNQTYLMIGHRVPLNFDGKYSLFSDELNRVNYKKLFSQHKDMIDFLKIKYSLKERIKYDVQFTESELNDWAGVNEFSKTVKGIIDNKINSDELIDYLGEELLEYEEYSSRETSQIFIGVNGVELFVDNDDYMTDVLNLSEDDEHYYWRAMGNYYYYDDEEVDSEELDYMSCWFEPDTIGKVSKLFALFGIDKRDTIQCTDYDEQEINDFLIKHFPLKWEQIGWDILGEAGRGLGKERANDARKYIEDEVAFEFEVGNSKTTMEITYTQLLFLIHAHNLEDLSGLIDQENSINEIDAGLYDLWYDTYDFGDAYDEIDHIFSGFLDDILENTEEIESRIKNGELLDSIVRNFGLKLKTYNNSYSAYINDNSITLYNIDLVNGTATLTKTVEVEPPEESAVMSGATRTRKNFNIELSDVPLYIDLANIFEDPEQEKDIKTTP